jgi:hypothetical protein
MSICVASQWNSCPASSGDGFNCWKECYSSPETTAQEVVTYAKTNGLDGLELDYEVNSLGIDPAESDFLVQTLASAKKLWPDGVMSISSRMAT